MLWSAQCGTHTIAIFSGSPGNVPLKSAPVLVATEAGLLCTVTAGVNKGRAAKAGTGGKCRTLCAGSQEVAAAESGASKVMSRGEDETCSRLHVEAKVCHGPCPWIGKQFTK